jgi:hypothetical protein
VPIDTSKVLEPQDGSLLEPYRAAVAAVIPVGVEVSEIFWDDLRTKINLFLEMHERWSRIPSSRQRWERIAELVRKLRNEMVIERKKTPWSHPDPLWPNRALAGLWEIKAQCDAYLTYYQMAAEARHWARHPDYEYLFQSVIDLWISLGQKETYSTSGGSRGGPLLSFFKACLEPLLGQLPDDTVRSVIRRRLRQVRVKRPC